MICSWCGKRIHAGPLGRTYCSSTCRIEELEADLTHAENEIASLRLERDELMGDH